MLSNCVQRIVTHIRQILYRITLQRPEEFEDLKESNNPEARTLQKPEGFEPIRIPIAGVLHQNPQWVFHSLSLSEPVWLRREDNALDENAISVETGRNRRLGYIGRTYNVKLAPYMDTGNNPLEAVVTVLARDISGEMVGMAVSFYLPTQLAREIRGEKGSWTSYCDIGTDGITYLFLDCDEAELNRVNEVLQRKGLSWQRSGLSYRVAPDDKQYRWYVRIEGEVSKKILEQTIKDTLGPKRETVEDYTTQFDEVMQHATKRSDLLEQKVLELRQEAKLSIQQGRSLQRQGLGEAIRILLPNMEHLHDSQTVILQKLEGYEPILRELWSLSNTPGDFKGKKVGGTEWKERHFNTGQKDDGRFYFRNDGTKWLVLVSFKKNQERDIKYLKSH